MPSNHICQIFYLVCYLYLAGRLGTSKTSIISCRINCDMGKASSERTWWEQVSGVLLMVLCRTLDPVSECLHFSPVSAAGSSFLLTQSGSSGDGRIAVFLPPTWETLIRFSALNLDLA